MLSDKEKRHTFYKHIKMLMKIQFNAKNKLKEKDDFIKILGQRL